MKRVIWVAGLMIGLLICGNAIAGSINIITEFDSPGDHPEGLAWDGGHLWMVSYNTEIIYKVDSTTFEVIQQVDSPDSEPGGLTYGDGYLWMGGNKNDKIYKINREDGNYTQIPGDYENPDGLAWQNGFLWVGLRDQKKLAKINPNTGQIILTLDLEGMPDGLTFDGSYLWYGEHINTGGTMNKIDPVSGEQLIQVDISNFADDVVGLTWDGMYFWISDDQKNKIFKIFYGDGTSSTDGCSQKELDAQFEAGKQYCIDNPESCGITTNDDPTCAQVITYGKVPSADCWVEFPTPCDVPTDWETANEKPEFMCGESSGDDRYDEGFQAGIATCDNPTPVADSNCATFDLFTNTLSVPCLDMGKIYWVDMQLVEDHLTISGFGEVE